MLYYFWRQLHSCLHLVCLVLSVAVCGLSLSLFSDEPPVLTKSAKASVAMMCISLVLVFLLCFGFSWRRRDGESGRQTPEEPQLFKTHTNKVTPKRTDALLPLQASRFTSNLHHQT